MAAYQVNDKTYRATDWATALNDVGTYHDPQSLTYQIKGKQVTHDQFIEACQAAREAWFAKKNLTHKQIRVSQGATTLPNTYITKWVKR